MNLVMELAPNGELFDYIAQTQTFPEHVARYYFKHLISALEYIHGRGFAHRDLKLQNFILNEKYDLKLADFGFSVRLAGRDGTGVLTTYKELLAILYQ